MDYSDYDDNFDDGFDDYDDAADDWEAEADQLEQEEKAKEAEKQARLEKKLATRAPVKKEEETFLPEDVQKEMARLSEEAGSIDDSLLKGNAVQIIADLPASTAEEATTVGQAIADRLLELSDKANFQEMITAFFKDVAPEFKSVAVINDAIGKAHVAAEELKRQKKASGGKKRVSKNDNADTDALNFAHVEDKGGAEVADDEETVW